MTNGIKMQCTYMPNTILNTKITLAYHYKCMYICFSSDTALK